MFSQSEMEAQGEQAQINIFSIDAEYERLQYNEQLQLIHHIPTDMFQCASINHSLCNHKKDDKIYKYFTSAKTQKLIKRIQADLGPPLLGGTATAGNISQIYENRSKLSNELKGYYIHRLLIPHYASWVNVEYCYMIQKLLDVHFTSTIHKLQAVVEQKDGEITQKNEVITQKDEVIQDTSVRIPRTERKLTIYSKDNLIQVSGDNKKVFPDIRYIMIFPSSMVVKTSLKNGLGKWKDFSEDELDILVEYLRSLNPKSITVV
jgi:hypothetical protein